MRSNIQKRLIQIMFVFFQFSLYANSISRIDAKKQKDLSGNWNDKDIRLVCENVIDECIESNFVKKFKKKNGRQPYVKVGTIMNLSDEFIDTTIVSNKFRNAIINSGDLKFVASDSEVEALRYEQMNQSDHVKIGEEALIGNEIGADFLLQGTIKTVIDQNGKILQKTYYVDVQLFDVESTEIVWTFENSDIVKVIERKKLRF